MANGRNCKACGKGIIGDTAKKVYGAAQKAVKWGKKAKPVSKL